MNAILPRVLGILESTLERWQRLAAVLPGELLATRPAPDQWSAVECLHHLLETEPVFAFRLQAFLNGMPEFPGYNPDAPENRLPADFQLVRLLDDFASRRDASLHTLRQVGADDLSRASRHAELGPVTLDQLLHEWAAHDLNHTIQAERALIQPFIQRSGPWKVYFSDLVIEAQP